MSTHPEPLRLSTGHYAFVPFGGRLLSNITLVGALHLVKQHDAIVSLVHWEELRVGELHKLVGRLHTTRVLTIEDVQNLTKDNPKFHKDMQNLRDGLQAIADNPEIEKIILHCMVGISRSSAATLWLMRMLDPKSSAKELVQTLVRDVNFLARPNLSILKWTEEFDPRMQGMVDAVQTEIKYHVFDSSFED